MKFSPVSFILSLSAGYFLLKHLRSVVFPWCEGLSFTFVQETGKMVRQCCRCRYWRVKSRPGRKGILRRMLAGTYWIRYAGNYSLNGIVMNGVLYGKELVRYWIIKRGPGRGAQIPGARSSCEPSVWDFVVSSLWCLWFWCVSLWCLWFWCVS
jgi:hypothetical protein